MKKTKVALEYKGKEKEFAFEHAENILGSPTNMQKGKSLWSLPKNSKFEFVNHELRTKSNKGSDKKSKAQAGDK